MTVVHRIKDKVNQLFARDRGLALMVAMEAALEGERWEVIFLGLRAHNVLGMTLMPGLGSKLCPHPPR